MARIGSAITQLAMLTMPQLPRFGNTGEGRLTDMTGFGSNPGALRGRSYIPEGLRAGAALVVVLHGCTQTGSGYDDGSGWSQIADECGFALLFPEQRRSNNPNLCFNCFSPFDSRRGNGEAHSVRQMIGAMIETYTIDERRIFVTGLSAGGAMASVMLASYPELFAGGAIIAGLPFGCATSVLEALARMRGEGFPADHRLAELVREASDHQGRWPTVSVWQGSADRIVCPSNSDRIIAQWQALHGIEKAMPERVTIGASKRRTWRDLSGRTAVEAYEIIGMGHGTPLDTGAPEGCGKAAPYMLEAGISSTRHIARFWGLSP